MHRQDRYADLCRDQARTKPRSNGRRRSTRARLGAIAAQLGGDRGSLDAALTHGAENAAAGWTLAGRHAFDFSRRVGSVLENGPEGSLLIVKGAPEGVLPLCTKRMDGTARRRWSRNNGLMFVQIHNLAGHGLRCIAVASRPWSGPTHDVDTTDEADLVFEGLCAFADPPKPSPGSQKRASGSRSSPATIPSS